MYVNPHAHSLKTHLVGCETYWGEGPVAPRTGPTGQEPTSPQRGEGGRLGPQGRREPLKCGWPGLPASCPH